MKAKVREIKEYLSKYDDEKEVNFILPSGQSWEVDENKMGSHNIKEETGVRENCKIFLK